MLPSLSFVLKVKFIQNEFSDMLRSILIVVIISTLKSLFSQPFVEVSISVGIIGQHSYQIENDPMHYRVCAPNAMADIDLDGDFDLYLDNGDAQVNQLFLNQGDGTFIDIAQQAGVALANFPASNVFFFDYNNDNYPDLFVSGLPGYPLRIFANNQQIAFEEIEVSTILDCSSPIYSMSAGDLNKDGYLDLFTTHWNTPDTSQHLWINQKDGSFRGSDNEWGWYNPFGATDFSFAANFADINQDGWPDILLSSDFGTSQVWLNDRGSRLLHVTDIDVISDENGMGNTVGDYDNDGDLDWFVTAVYDYDGVTEGNWGKTGNRLYQNDGSGNFHEMSQQAGVRNGAWGWGASFADFNNDGWLDIIHTNGWPQGSDQFYQDSVRLFISQQDGTFEETAWELGLQDTKQGRGLSVFDYEKDGDLDVFISNYRDSPSLWRNDLNKSNNTNYLTIGFSDIPINQVVGTKITAHTSSGKQLRVVSCGTNYNAQNPLEVHFGLGSEVVIDSLVVEWPNGQQYVYYQLAVNQRLILPSIVTPINESGAFMVYPNPFREELNISFGPDFGTPSALNIYSTDGKLIWQTKRLFFLQDRYYAQWHLASQAIILPSGLYYLEIKQDGKPSKVQAILKQ